MKGIICGKEINTEWSNNAYPLENGECCDDCNMLVIKSRIIELYYKTNKDVFTKLIKQELLENPQLEEKYFL